MAEDDDIAARAADSSAAARIAATGASREKADAYLDEQIALARLERESLVEQNAFELSHLRWRRFNDQMKGAMQIMLVAIGLLIVVGIAAALWNASQADGLVVDAFTVPPSFAAQGLGGDVLATDIINRLSGIRSIAVANSLTSSGSVSKNDANAVKVEIPDTGVSLGEAWRYLRAWLGDENHVSGSLRQLPDGTVELGAALDGGEILTVSGKATDIDTLEQRLAEKIFAAFDPSNDVIYLANKNRVAEAYAQATHNVVQAARGLPPALAYSLWSNVTRSIGGDVPLAVIRAKTALALDPHLQAAFNELSIEEGMLGHDEAALAAAHDAVSQAEADQPKPLQGEGYRNVKRFALRRASQLVGDFVTAERAACDGDCVPDNLDDAAVFAARTHDAKSAHAFIEQARALGHVSPVAENEAVIYAALESGDWSVIQAAIAARPRLYLAYYSGAGAALFALLEKTKIDPLLADILVREGDTARAAGVIASTPMDCYDCVRLRGVIAAAHHDWKGAAQWFFGEAVKQAPSLPFAYLDWGRMLLAKGDIDGAIAKFSLAHDKGPAFADPLEAWGEALMAKNRSDLALAKFAEANQNAPNWGRLHLKWGEALLFAGDENAAKKELSRAATLTLTPAEKKELARAQWH